MLLHPEFQNRQYTCSIHALTHANTPHIELDHKTISVIRPNSTDTILYELHEPNVTQKYNINKSPVHFQNSMCNIYNSGYMAKKHIAVKPIRIPKLTHQTKLL